MHVAQAVGQGIPDVEHKLTTGSGVIHLYRYPGLTPSAANTLLHKVRLICFYLLLTFWQPDNLISCVGFRLTQFRVCHTVCLQKPGQLLVSLCS